MADVSPFAMTGSSNLGDATQVKPQKTGALTTQDSQQSGRLVVDAGAAIKNKKRASLRDRVLQQSMSPVN
jgi:hypothetical protein